MQENLTIITRKFNNFCEIIWQFFRKHLATFVGKFLHFLEENLIIFKRKCDDFCKKGWRSWWALVTFHIIVVQTSQGSHSQKARVEPKWNSSGPLVTLHIVLLQTSRDFHLWSAFVELQWSGWNGNVEHPFTVGMSNVSIIIDYTR